MFGLNINVFICYTFSMSHKIPVKYIKDCCCNLTKCGKTSRNLNTLVSHYIPRKADDGCIKGMKVLSFLL